MKQVPQAKVLAREEALDRAAGLVEVPAGTAFAPSAVNVCRTRRDNRALRRNVPNARKQ